ncbi:ABC transporter ATP-binding protein [Desulfolutivibrio sulfoxidireducens]|uniref:ABC transporter ATP-binding protein n=1 Tax=Desulfolutivibrio sulfoxidireducens TaxID=2773299 RepID=UPI00159E8366|nr:ABC transporter ATP-binding protein [Desulfolutivibrio sulfoxidireducens]QLA17805.1 ATP-binding cassette domain-containing protein [Desulfolutivibrio sulfoxidireducens]
MKLRARQLDVGYRDRPVLMDVDFEVAPGEILAVLGRNGVGKTTLLRTLNAMLPARGGAVLVEDADILGLTSREIARTMGYVPQRSEAGKLTAFDAILLGRVPHLRFSVRPEDLCVVEAAIRRLGLEELALRNLDRMSGGELQKVCIARALVQEPSVLLLDEPTSSLDLKNQMEILSLVREVAMGHGVGVVMTMHDLSTALRFADRFLFLQKGRVLAVCDRAGLSPEVIGEAYGVPVSIEWIRGCPVVIPEN